MAMIKAVLLDLDNTLLFNPDSTFAANYLALADDYFNRCWGYAEISKVILKTIRAMTSPHTPDKTNSMIALEIIAEAVGRDIAEVYTTFDDFYRDCYPTLHQYTTALGAVAPHLITKLQAEGYAVVIATNPIYPAEAIRQRLQWAGIPDDFKAYTLVTHAQNMHVAKPDPAYYAEIVARVGIEPDEALMVGDSLKNDMTPAAQVGLHTYRIESADAIQLDEALDAFSSDYANKENLESLLSPPLHPAMIIPEMRGNLGALFGTLAEVQPHFWNQHPDPNEWSPIQVLCHLLESERQVQRPRLERILAQDNPFLVSPPPPAGPSEAYPCAEDGLIVAHSFAAERAITLNWLEKLPPEAWNRPARHSIFGLTTLLEMAHFTAQHDRLHINQLCQTIGKCK